MKEIENIFLKEKKNRWFKLFQVAMMSTSDFQRPSCFRSGSLWLKRDFFGLLAINVDGMSQKPSGVSPLIGGGPCDGSGGASAFLRRT